MGRDKGAQTTHAALESLDKLEKEWQRGPSVRAPPFLSIMHLTARPAPAPPPLLQPYHVPLQPGQELSLEYPIMMPPNLPARDFILQIGVWMSEGTAEEPSHQQHLFYNEVRRRWGWGWGGGSSSASCDLVVAGEAAAGAKGVAGGRWQRRGGLAAVPLCLQAPPLAND